MPKMTNGNETPKTLKPFIFHGVDLDWDDKQAKGECPFCGKTGKFTVEVATGKFRCWSCGTGNEKGGGNALTFLRKLHDSCNADEAPLKALADERGILSWETLVRWGVAVSPLTNQYVVPGYSADGRLGNLYRWTKVGEKYRLLATPGMEHQLFGAQNFDKSKPSVHVTEGPWDGMVWEESLNAAKKMNDGSFTATGSAEASIGAKINVIATPGANVFNEWWAGLLDGKEAVFLFDSDRPRENNGRQVDAAGFAGVKRNVAMLAIKTEGKPRHVSWLAWGPQGYDPSLAPGYDLRDALKDCGSVGERAHALGELMGRIEPVPAEWTPGRKAAAREAKKDGEPEIECLPCEKWDVLMSAWRKAFRMTEGLEASLACMLATSACTMAIGDQLWMRIMGPAACVSRSTKINYVTKRKDGKLVNKKGGPIGILFERFNGLPQTTEGPIWEKDVDFYVQSVSDDGEISCNKIQKVVYSGVKEVYRVVTESGKVLETTKDHEFMVGDGSYRQLARLKVGDVVLSNPGKTAKKGRKPSVRRSEIMVKYHPAENWNTVDVYRYCRVRVYRAVYEAEQNGMTYQQYVNYLNTRSPEEIRFLWTIPDGWEIHHIDENPINNSIDNLELIEGLNHRMRHVGESIKAISIVVVEDKIASIKKVGSKRVYDIVCSDPYRNFLAGGVVVHNCGKSTLCEALSVNKKYIYPKSTLRGFHSGFDDGSGENHSPLQQMSGKTLVIKDGDTLLSSPNLDQILSEARDVYDRVSRSSYRGKMSKDWEGLNISIILCGTASLRKLDSSELGERFLSCIITEGIDEELEEEIVWRKVNQAERSMSQEADGSPESQHDPAMLKAMQLTGGYVGWLRQNSRDLIHAVHRSELALRRIASLAVFVAYLRARPSTKQDEVADREFGTRLASQLTRLAKGLAVVMNRGTMDERVMTVVKKVALDTANGRTLNIVRMLAEAGEKGCSAGSLAVRGNSTEDKERSLLRFMQKIKAVETVPEKGSKQVRWRLTARMETLYRTVISIQV